MCWYKENKVCYSNDILVDFQWGFEGPFTPKEPFIAMYIQWIGPCPSVKLQLWLYSCVEEHLASLVLFGKFSCGATIGVAMLPHDWSKIVQFLKVWLVNGGLRPLAKQHTGAVLNRCMLLTHRGPIDVSSLSFFQGNIELKISPSLVRRLATWIIACIERTFHPLGA